MARCSNCGAESTRVRSRWLKGKQLPDQCPACAPGEFEKFTAPSDKKIAMGFEAHPNQYEKRYDSDGVFYVRKPEYRAEQEDRLQRQPEDERLAEQMAIDEKRATRRTQPMSPGETRVALAKAKIIADAIEESAALAQKQAQEAELQSWMRKSVQA